ncbi:MAG: RNA 2',3'-cyclic phosphodiesterase [Dehalococcoidia bacterium]
MTADPAEPQRLFVAVELAPATREALAELQARLRRRSLDSLRWVRPPGIHLTLKFLGETPSDRLPAVRQALARSVAGALPHRLSLGPLGTFGGRRGPQVLWVALAGELEPLSLLQSKVEQELEGAGFDRERREFAPHLTLARVRPELARSLAARIAEALPQVPVPPVEIEVRQVSLMRSTLQSGGAVYEQLAAFALG